MALQSRARELAKAIEDETCCAYCLLGFSRTLSARPEELEELRRGCHELWNACVHAITTPAHGDPQHESPRFLRRLRAAAAGCPRHNDTVQLGSYLTKTLIDAACNTLHVCLSVGERSAVSRAQKKHKAFSNKRDAWPMRQEDLFPSGVDGTGKLIDVLKLKAWTLYVESPSPAFLLADLLYIAYPLVFPVVIDNHKNLVLLVARWICNPTAASMILGHEEEREAAFYMHEQQTAAAVALLRSLRDAPDADPNALLQFTLYREEFLYSSCELGLKTLNALHGPDSELAGDIAELAALMHTRLAQPDSALSPAVRARLPAASTLDLAGVLHALLQTLASRRRICGNPHCETSVHAQADPDATFRRCARCKLMHYCSTACQRDDWKNGRGIPHKGACEVFLQIKERADPALPLHAFRAALAPHLAFAENRLNLSLFAISMSSLLPMELIVRAKQLHEEAAAALGRPSILAGVSPDMETVENILMRQAQWASVNTP